MTYICCKKIIEKAIYTIQSQKDEMQMKLDIFLLNNRMTDVQYNELTTMLTDKEIVVQEEVTPTV